MKRPGIGNILLLSVFSVVLVLYIRCTSHVQWDCRQNLHLDTHSLGSAVNMSGMVREESSADTRNYDWSAAARRFDARLRHLRRVCKNNSKKTKWAPNYLFLVDIPRRFLMCAVFKSGSSAWHRVFWSLRRKRDHLSIDDQKFYTPNDTIRNFGMANHLPESDGVELLKRVHGDDDFQREQPPVGSSFRMVLARHPFARFISGWNQKFRLDTNYWVNIFKTYRGLIDYKKVIDETHVIAFEDFASYAANNGLKIQTLDAHFRPASTLCNICSYDYTYIIKAETAETDEPWLNRRLGLEDIHIGKRGVAGGGSVVNGDLVNNIKKYMSKLKPDVIKSLYNIYAMDFAYFGYTFNFTTLEAGGFE